MQWYYAVKGQQQGPVEWDALVALARDGKITPSDLVWNSTLGSQWAKASTIPGLFATETVFPATPPSAAEWTQDARFKSSVHNRDLMGAARSALAGRWGTGVGGFLVYLLVTIALSVLAALIPVLGQIAVFVVTGALMLGWYLFFLTIARRQEAEIGLLFEGFKQFGTALLAYFLMGLLVFAWALPGIVMVIVTVVAGVFHGAPGFVGIRHGVPGSAGILILLVAASLAAFIPAVVAQYRYSLTYFVINDTPGMGALEAIRHSTRLMSGNKWKLLCLQFRFLGWALLCLLSLGIGFLWLTPYMMTSLACFYEDVRKGPSGG
jgi:uncharacterized membrane protein